jgi:hypothetical protein
MKEYEKVNFVVSYIHAVLMGHPNMTRIRNKEREDYEFFKDGELFLQWGPWDSENNWEDHDRYFLVFKDGASKEPQKFLFRDWYDFTPEEIKQQMHFLLGEDYTIKTKPDFIKEIQDKVKTTTYHELDDDSFERLVKLVYEKKYEFVADIECGNDSSHTFNVDGKAYDTNGVEKFKTTGHYSYLAGDLLNDLAAQDILPKGEWIIGVSW